MRVWFAGGAWVRGSSYGTLYSNASQDLTGIDKLLPRVPARFGRFDEFTRMGLTAVGLALREAGWLDATKLEVTGLIVSTRYGVMQTDLNYYATTIEQDALLSSPNLFSYTLPVTVIGECAILFQLTGPTFCVGDDGRTGIRALEAAMLLLQGKRAQRMIAAFVEAPPDLGAALATQAGAVAVAMEPAISDSAPGKSKLVYNETVTSLSDLFSRSISP